MAAITEVVEYTVAVTHDVDTLGIIVLLYRSWSPRLIVGSLCVNSEMGIVRSA